MAREIAGPRKEPIPAILRNGYPVKLHSKDFVHTHRVSAAPKLPQKSLLQWASVSGEKHNRTKCSAYGILTVSSHVHTEHLYHLRHREHWKREGKDGRERGWGYVL